MASKDYRYHKRIYSADDEEGIRQAIHDFLTSRGYEVVSFADGYQLLDALKEAKRKPDLILLDIKMEGLDGIATARLIRQEEKNKSIPLIAVTGNLAPELYKDLFENGFFDALEKPINNDLLDKRVKYALENSQIPSFKRLSDVLTLTIANMGDARDTHTENHNLRLGDICAALSLELQLTNFSPEDFRLAARLHDIGKLSVRDAILQKPGKLTPDEFDEMKMHTVAGANMIEPLSDNLNLDYLKITPLICLYHHEKMDGSGYPQGLKGPDIPFYVRIATVADIYDAVTMKRPYHPARSHEDGLKVIKEEMELGKLDRDVVAAFFRKEKDIKDLKRLYK